MKVLIFDTETTGTDPQHDQIIEAAWLDIPDTVGGFLAIKNPTKFPSYNQRFRPSVPISYGAMATHSIIGSDLDGCPSSALVELPIGVEFIIGHKIDFDCDMMNGAATGVPDTTRRICTLALSRWLFPELDSHRQEAMLYYIGHQIDNPEWARGLLTNSHAALDDVIVCSILLRFLIAKIRKLKLNCDTWEELALLSDTARIPTTMGFGKHKGDKIADVPSSYIRWYRGQAETDPYYLEAFKRAGK